MRRAHSSRSILPVALLFASAACSSNPSEPNGSPSNDGGTDGGADAAFDAPGDSSPPAVDDLAPVLEPIRSASGLPALGAAVWRDEALVALGVTGVRKYGDPTPAETDDLWHLGSDTKAMTATLIGIHVDRGEIQLDDTIADLYSGETIDPGYAAVTVRDLLQHRGGAPGAVPATIWAKMWADGQAPSARSDAVLAMLALPPEQTPGTFVYSNAGYMMAGVALERKTGQTWEEMMQKDLFEPLGMTSCGFGAPGSPNVVDQPWGHDVSAPSAPPTPVAPGPQADNPPSLGPAGTVHCSLTDWGKFLAVHLAGARGESSQLISLATITELQTPPAGGDYACGWGVTTRPWAGGLTLTHNGSNTYWFATTWLAPAKNVVLSVVTNQGDDIAATTVDEAFGPLITTYVP